MNKIENIITWEVVVYDIHTNEGFTSPPLATKEEAECWLSFVRKISVYHTTWIRNSEGQEFDRINIEFKDGLDLESNALDAIKNSSDKAIEKSKTPAGTIAHMPRVELFGYSVLVDIRVRPDHVYKTSNYREVVPNDKAIEFLNFLCKSGMDPLKKALVEHWV